MNKGIQSLFYIGALVFMAGWGSWRIAGFSYGFIIQLIGLVLMIPYWIQRSYKLFNLNKYPAEQKSNIIFTGVLSLFILLLIIYFIIRVCTL